MADHKARFLPAVSGLDHDTVQWSALRSASPSSRNYPSRTPMADLTQKWAKSNTRCPKLSGSASRVVPEEHVALSLSRGSGNTTAVQSSFCRKPVLSHASLPWTEASQSKLVAFPWSTQTARRVLCDEKQETKGPGT